MSSPVFYFLKQNTGQYSMATFNSLGPADIVNFFLCNFCERTLLGKPTYSFSPTLSLDSLLPVLFTNNIGLFEVAFRMMEENKISHKIKNNFYYSFLCTFFRYKVG